LIVMSQAITNNAIMATTNHPLSPYKQVVGIWS
jgi:hypothetical protein